MPKRRRVLVTETSHSYPTAAASNEGGGAEAAAADGYPLEATRSKISAGVFQHVQERRRPSHGLGPLYLSAHVFC